MKFPSYHHLVAPKLISFPCKVILQSKHQWPHFPKLFHTLRAIIPNESAEHSHGGLYKMPWLTRDQVQRKKRKQRHQHIYATHKHTWHTASSSKHHTLHQLRKHYKNMLICTRQQTTSYGMNGIENPAHSQKSAPTYLRNDDFQLILNPNSNSAEMHPSPS